MEAYLQTEDLAVGYQGRTLIGEISLAVQRGRIVTLIGPNGSGKSTILKTIIGQLPSISGSVFLDGADMRSRSRGDVARRMAILMTARMDPELMTCRDVVSTGRYPYTGHLGVLRPEDKAIVEQSLRETDALDFADRHPDKIVWCGEFGTIRHANIAWREHWMNDVILLLKRHDISYCVWNYLSTPNDGNRFSLADDENRKILSENLKKILLGDVKEY